jgi:hypothetical protein
MSDSITMVRPLLGKVAAKWRGQNGTGSQAEALQQAYATGWRHARCLFVLSTGRVGTETLAALFALCPDAVAHHEPEPRLVKASFDAYMEGCSGQKWLDLVLAARDDFIVTANHQQKIYIETSNRLTYLAPALARTFPESRFIHLHRHPYDVVRSYVKRQAYEGHPWDFARIRPRAGDADASQWERLSSVEKIAWYWARVNRDAHDFLRTLPASRGLEIRADTLFRADASTLTKLFAFAGVTCPSPRKVRHVLAGKLNANTLPHDWEWTEADRQRVQQLTSSVAVDLAYEL